MRCVIIEDELPAQRILLSYIVKLPDLKLIGSFQSALQANKTLQREAIDVVFLDINLPDISGIQYIKTLSSPPAIIMTTAYHEHAVESFELDTICDYLVKPFSFARFLKAINKTKNRSKPTQSNLTRHEVPSETIFLNIDKTLHKIVLSDIMYIESDKNYVTVATENGKYSYIDSLKNWIEKLDKRLFAQVHRSYIVNFSKIEKISGNLIFIGTKKIPVGRLYKTSLLNKLKIG